jgi:threonine aldolase
MTIPALKNSLTCDLRSDTITAPDEGMRSVMASAEVGDDVYGEDPTVTSLEKRLASMLGKEAGVFFPSGTQSNLAALMAHCGRGDEIIVGKNYHINWDEASGASVLAGISLWPVETQPNGSITPETILDAIKEDDPHFARTRLLCLENTVGGKAIPIDTIKSAAQTAWDSNLSVHLDGARFFNAVTALGCSPKDLADCADSISVCLSKGLGTPVGTVLTGSKQFIRSARRNRKILGGSMRQVGIIAAAGHYALDHNISRLSEDHKRAKHFASALQEIDAGIVETGTNMVFFTPKDGKTSELRSFMEEQGVKIGDQSPSIRMVLHRDITDYGMESAISSFKNYYK